MNAELKINGLVAMYVGNLEEYQGINLLLDSFRLVLDKTEHVNLVIIGGQPSDIQKYKNRSRELRMQREVDFLGPKPVDDLGKYLSAADILVSPRIKGNNTPMKLYSYLHSGKPMLATDLSTHTQVLDNSVAVLTKASPEAFSQGMLVLIEDEALRLRLGKAGKKLVEEKYSYPVFRDKLNGLFNWLEKETKQERYVETGGGKGRSKWLHRR